MIRVTTAKIKKLDPCADRLNNYLVHYAKFSGSLKEFFILQEITHSDKLWVAFRLMTKKQRILCACAVAKSTLGNFEKCYPKDKRPRRAINGALAYANGKIKLAELRILKSAARSAWSAAESAWSAAARSAWSAAESAWSAAESAARSAWSAAESAARSAWSAALFDEHDFEAQQLKLILRMLK